MLKLRLFLVDSASGDMPGHVEQLPDRWLVYVMSEVEVGGEREKPISSNFTFILCGHDNTEILCSPSRGKADSEQENSNMSSFMPIS